MANTVDWDDHTQVPDFLQKGAHFQLCQDTFTSSLQPLQKCLIRVDQHGFFLYWRSQDQEAQYIDCNQIKEICSRGYQMKDQKAYTLLESQAKVGTATICDRIIILVCGSDMVNYSTFLLLAEDFQTSQKWISGLREFIHRPAHRNISLTMALKKHWMKLCFSANKNDKISVKSISRPFSAGKNSKAALQGLKELDLPSSKNEFIDLKDFTFEKFYQLYKKAAPRTDVAKVFNSLTCGARCNYVEIGPLAQWMNDHQRDPRLNEILFPMFDHKRTKQLIDIYEPDPDLAKKGRLTLEGFTLYLSSLENSPVYRERLTVFEDMEQPLCHYSINSSHNTYLNGRQFIGDSSVEMYRQVLLTGCRCIELDCWDGKGENQGEPIITHGMAMCTDINFVDVIHAINETAFVTSEYPLILSFENHCSKPLQVKLAKYCEEIFGDKLLRKPLDEFPLEPGQQLPTPNALKRKIIIKNKRLKPDVEKIQLERYYKRAEVPGSEEEVEETQEEDSSSVEEAHPEYQTAKTEEQSVAEENFVRNNNNAVHKTDSIKTNGSLSKDETIKHVDSTAEMSSKTGKTKSKNKGLQLTEEDEKELLRNYKYVETSSTNIHAVLSSLINYCQSVKFQGFEYAEEQKISYQMSSFSESAGVGLLKTSAIEFVNYNKRQLSRIYPRGNRVDSSNYMPQVFWNAGCQMVSLNFQTSDLSMQLNQGRFEYNGASGFLLKPEFMRREDRTFDPFSESPVDGVIAAHCSIEVISGLFLSDKQIGTYVEVDMYGLPTDTIRKEHRTKLVPSNGLDPVYNSPPFVFRKVILPNLALVRFAVHDENGKLLGQRVIPLEALQCGYRHISLRTASGHTMDPASIFCNIVLKSYVPDGLSEFVNALADPKKYLSIAEARASQMRNMGIDDDDLNDGGKTNGKAVKDSVKMKRSSTSDLERKSTQSFHVSESDPGFTSLSTRTSSSNDEKIKKSIASTTHRQYLPSASHMTQQIPVNDLMQREPVTVETLAEDALYRKLVANQTKEIQKLKNKLLKDCQTLERKHREKLYDMVVRMEQADAAPSSSLCCFTPRLRNAIVSDEDLKSRLNSLPNVDSEKVLSLQRSQKDVELSCTKTYNDTLSRINEHHQRQQVESLDRALQSAHKLVLDNLKAAQEKEMNELTNHQTKSSMMSTRGISLDKSIKKAEKDRRIREMSSSNAKKFVEERHMMTSKHTRQIEKIESEQDSEIAAIRESIKKYVDEQIKERRSGLEIGAGDGNIEKPKPKNLRVVERLESDVFQESSHCDVIVE